MNKIACPINSVKNERRFYKQEIAKLTKKIKALYSKDIPPYSETLSSLDKRRRVAYQCKPADIFRNLDSGASTFRACQGTAKSRKTNGCAKSCIKTNGGKGRTGQMKEFATRPIRHLAGSRYPKQNRQGIAPAVV